MVQFKSLSFRGWLMIGAAGLGLTPLSAHAQQSSPAASAQRAAESSTLTEVIVTAQKRSEPLQSVPISAQVVQGQALQVQNTNSLTDLSETMPEIHITSAGEQFGNTLNIRGIGSGASNPAFDQSVASFVDDIYYGRSRMIQATFLDLDHIEVLKGPQSTFFGNNAIAGALNITTKKPDDQFDGYLRALYGSYGQYALEGATSIPVSDTFAVRLAGMADGDRGWIRNVGAGGWGPGERNYAGRATFEWKPTTDFEAVFKAEGTSNLITNAYNEVPGQVTLCPPPAPFTLTTNSRFKYCAVALANNAPLGLNNDENSTLPGQFARLSTNDEVLTLNYTHWGLTFTSVSGYYNYQFDSQQDNANAGNVVASTTSPTEDYRQFSQELRVASPADRPISYMAGAYFQTDHINELVNGNAAFSSGVLHAVLGIPLSQLPLGYDIGYNQDETVVSGFAAATWNATDKLKFNGGFRYTSDHKNFLGNVGYGHETQTYGGFVPYPANLNALAGLIIGPPGLFPYTRTDNAPMGSAGVQYQLEPAAMVYFTYNHGFKAGGFSGTSPNPITTIFGQKIAPAFGPETVDSYEFGLKSKWFDNHLLLNLDYFREDYANLQLNTTVQLALNATIVPANAGSALSQGVELESQWLVTNHFSISADVTYLDARYVTFPSAPPTLLQTFNHQKSQNLAGQPLDFAPAWGGAITGEYKMPLPDNFMLTAHLTGIFSSSYFDSAGTDDPLFLIPGSARLDGTLTLDTNRGWAFDLIGKNLTDAVIPLSYGTGTSLGGKEEPISVAIQVRYKW